MSIQPSTPVFKPVKHRRVINTHSVAAMLVVFWTIMLHKFTVDPFAELLGSQPLAYLLWFGAAGLLLKYLLSE